MMWKRLTARLNRRHAPASARKQAVRPGDGSQRGLTYVELVVAASVLAVLASAVIPIYRWHHKRTKEEQLRTYLFQMRRAIDLYHDMSQQGLIPMEDPDEEMNWPRSLEELVEGFEVLDPTTGETTEMRLLPRMPIDPMNESLEWGLRSYQDDFDSTNWGGENVYDVYSLSRGIALDGTYYGEW